MRIPNVLVVSCILLIPAAGIAGPTERACLRSERSPGHEACACAQALADQVLTLRDQEQAARIIDDPDMYVAYARRNNRATQAFLERYKLWGQEAATRCRPAG